MEHLIEELKKIDSDALHIVRTVLKARVDSAMTRTDNIELRSDVRRIYSILSRIIEHAQGEAFDEEVTQIRNLFVIDEPEEAKSCAE
jgi:hypothetical protein